MTTNKFEDLIKINISASEEEYSIPLDMSDLISVCQEFSNLGLQIQSQIEHILELGIEESIKSGLIKKEHLPQLKKFLKIINQNPYFGDACSQSGDLILKIDKIIGLKKSYNFN